MEIRRCQCHDGVKDECEKKKGRRLRLELVGEGGSHVHGAGEAEHCRREAEKGQEEEWHCVNHGEVWERGSSDHLPKGHGRVKWDEAGEVMFGVTSQIQCGGGKEKYF